MKKILSLILLALLVSATLASCGTKVLWYDADGTLLYSEKLAKDATSIPQKELPADSDEWDYTEWAEISADEKEIILEAQRIAVKRFIWRDADGGEISTMVLPVGVEPPEYALPPDTSNWDYTTWKISEEGNATVYTAQRRAVVAVVWTGVSGEVLYSAYIAPDEDVPERFLPNDTSEWHYTGWKRVETLDGSIKFVAERVKKENIHYLDVDGSLLYTDSKAPDAELVLRALPKNNSKWIYTAWEEVTETGGERTFRALGDINPDYFKGNVFQIATYDFDGNPIALGTGFIFNKNGWFITNYHVLEGAVTAEAIFEIENFSKGDSYTKLAIDKGYFSNPDKDIFIGRISEYSKISNKYQNIPMVKTYELGDITYSVGYPLGTTTMEIHKGEVVSEHDKDFNNLYEKLYSGVTYIPTSSYMHHGSSGGILVNENLEVIGMTSRALIDKKDNFVVGAAIRAFAYMSTAGTVNQSAEKTMLEVLYPEFGAGINVFLNAANHKNCTGLYKNSAGYYYQLEWQNLNEYNDEAWVFQVYANGSVGGNLTRIYSDDGDIMTSTLAGVYGGEDTFDGFTYIYTYYWGDGGGMTMSSSDINYSATVDQTLKTYKTTADGIKISADNISYARKRFNETYVWLRDLLKELNK